MSFNVYLVHPSGNSGPYQFCKPKLVLYGNARIASSKNAFAVIPKGTSVKSIVCNYSTFQSMSSDGYQRTANTLLSLMNTSTSKLPPTGQRNVFTRI